jgi:hypothetical protein
MINKVDSKSPYEVSRRYWPDINIPRDKLEERTVAVLNSALFPDLDIHRYYYKSRSFLGPSKPGRQTVIVSKHRGH